MKILVAEDEPRILQIYKLFLEERGHEVYTTVDGEQCVAVYKLLRDVGMYCDRKTPCDLVVLDYRMPKRDGVQAAKDILDIAPEQKILMITAYNKDLVDTSGKLKNIGLLLKPIDPDDFVEAAEAMASSVSAGLKPTNTKSNAT